MDNNKTMTSGSIFNVCLMGASLDTGNRGVSALAASLIKVVLGARPDAAIILVVGSRSSSPQQLKVFGHKKTFPVANYRLSARAHIQEQLFWIFLMACLQRVLPFKKVREKIIQSSRLLTALEKSDFVGDIHGGDSFSDIYGFRRFIIGVMPRIIALLLRKKLVLLPQTYGPYYSRLSKQIARFILKRSSRIISRDREGIEIVKNILGKGLPDKKIQFCPDVAFVLDSRKPDGLDIYPPIEKNFDTALIGFNISGLLYNGGYSRDNMFGLKCDYRSFVHNLVKRFMEETTAHVLLIPHTFGSPGNINSDPDACRIVFDRISGNYRKRVHLVMKEYDQYEIKAIISLCDFFIGSRMHACIAALSQGIPTVGVAYSRKFAGVLESVGIGHMVIDAKSLDTETAIEKVLFSYEKLTKEKKILQKKIHTVKNHIHKTFQDILISEAMAGAK